MASFAGLYRIRAAVLDLMAFLMMPNRPVSDASMYLASSFAEMRAVSLILMCFEDDAMSDLYVVSRIDEFRSICISTLARDTVQDADASHLGDSGGYFIYEVDERPIFGGLSVLAKAASSEAAYRLAEMWSSKGAVTP